MAEQEEQKYNPGELYKDLDKYSLAAYADEQLRAGNEEEGQLAGMAYLTRSGGLEDLLKATGFDKTPREAVQKYSQIYQRKLHELKVTDVLDYIKASDEKKEGLAKYLTKTVEDLYEGALKYQKADKDWHEAKTNEESLSATNRKLKYESMYYAHNYMKELNSNFIKEKSAPEVANYKRKKLAEKYKDRI